MGSAWWGEVPTGQRGTPGSSPLAFVSAGNRVSMLETIKTHFSKYFVSYYLNKENVVVIKVCSNNIFSLFLYHTCL